MSHPQSHAFAIGDFRCAVVADGAAPLDTDRLNARFPGIPPADLQAALAELGIAPETLHTYLNALLVRTSDDTVLFDTGNGTATRPTTGHLLSSMAEAGVEPEDVTVVVITHCHGDHINGVRDGDTPVFPNARYVISAPEWDYWQGRVDDDPANMAGLGQSLALMARGDLARITPGDEIVPGLLSVPLPGHTPGQIGVLVESGDDSLLHLVDALHMPFQLPHPDWSIKFDTDKAQAARTRREVLARAHDEGRFTLFYHLPFPGLGRVHRDGDGFTWQPLAVE